MVLSAESANYQSVSTTTISSATVANASFRYYLVLRTNQNTSNCRLDRVLITYPIGGPGQ